PDIVYATFILLIMANLSLIPAAWFCIRGFGRIIAFPTAILLGLIVICSLIGVYLPRGNMFDVWVTLAIGVVAFFMRITSFPIAPLLIGYVLSNQLEYRMSQVCIYLGGGSLLDYTLDHPVAIVLFAVALVLLVLPFFRGEKIEGDCRGDLDVM
ncbi:MAG: tripartite tricarboxylate transporter permease, partial [Mailhella sp.]|nr:tripartite tricarboxylate transporter permease [Mailhella sp.]